MLGEVPLELPHSAFCPFLGGVVDEVVFDVLDAAVVHRSMIDGRPDGGMSRSAHLP